MTEHNPFNCLLVATDFSDGSQDAFRWALRYVDRDESAIVVLHVLDVELIETITSHDFASDEDVIRRMRQRAEEQLAPYKESAGPGLEIDTIVCEGLPFLEIVRKADDFAVDAIVMGKVGTRGKLENLLFGSTAEKVLRGARRPVIVLPGSK